MTTKRLLTELKGFQQDSQVLQLKPVSDTNLSHWQAVIRGTDLYENGFFKLDIQVSSNYPIEPPEIKFLTRICHPNIHFKVILIEKYS